ncbi:MAG: hypothetical protein RLZZ351_212 [Pseudomonadota bacterium]
MFKRTFMSFLLPLLFLFAQHSAVTHEITHYSEQAPLTQQKQQAPHSLICDKCVAYGEMASALDSPSFHIPVIPTIAIQVDGYQYTQSRHVVVSYQARAPPLFS